VRLQARQSRHADVLDTVNAALLPYGWVQLLTGPLVVYQRMLIAASGRMGKHSMYIMLVLGDDVQYACCVVCVRTRRDPWLRGS
jgi:hypothetical protein